LASSAKVEEERIAKAALDAIAAEKAEIAAAI